MAEVDNSSLKEYDHTHSKAIDMDLRLDDMRADVNDNIADNFHCNSMDDIHVWRETVCDVPL